MARLYETQIEEMTNDELLAARELLNEKLKKGPENISATLDDDRPSVPVSERFIILSIDPKGPKIDDIKSKKGQGELIATSRGWQKVEGAENISYNLNVTRWKQ